MSLNRVLILHYFEIISSKSEEFCRKKVTKYADDSSRNFAKPLYHCSEYLNWWRSSVLSLRTENLIIAMEICMAGSNKTGPVSEFQNCCLYLLLPRYLLTLKEQQFILVGIIPVLVLEGKEITSSLHWDASSLPAWLADKIAVRPNFFFLRMGVLAHVIYLSTSLLMIAKFKKKHQ